MSPIHIIVHVDINKENQETCLPLFEELSIASRAEEGNVYYEFIHVKDDSFLILELWKSQDAVDIHNNSPHFTSIVPQVAALSNFKSITKYTDIGNVESTLPIALPKKPIVLLLLEFELKSNKEEILNLSQDLITESRKEEGWYVYTMCQSEANPDIYTFIDVWDSQAALDLHRTKSHSQQIVPKQDHWCLT